MGFVSFKNWCVIFIFILVTTYCVSAFRLIRTTPQTQDNKKDPELTETKQHERKISSWKEELISSHKEKHSNQTLKLHYKSTSEIDESDDGDESDEHETIKDEKKLKIVLPLNITKEKYVAKGNKVDKLSLKGKSINEDDVEENGAEEDGDEEEEEDNNEDLTEKQVLKLKKEEKTGKLDKEKIARIHERRMGTKEEKGTKHVEIKISDGESVKEKKGLDKEKIVKIHEKRVEAKEEKVKIKDEEPIKEKKGLDKDKIAMIHEKRIEAKEEKSTKHVEIIPKENIEVPIKDKRSLDKEKIAKIHETHAADMKVDKKVKILEKPEKKLVEKSVEKSVPKPEKKMPVPEQIKEMKQVEKKLLDKKTEEKKPLEKKPVETKPLDKKPEEKKPLEKKPVETKAEEKKAVEKKESVKTPDKLAAVRQEKKITEDIIPVKISEKVQKQPIKEETKVKPKVETTVKPPEIKESKTWSPPKEKPIPKEPLKESKPSKPVEKPPKEPSKQTVTDPSEANMLYYNLPAFSPNFDSLDNEECKKQGHILLEQLTQRKLWALKMFDSTAKVPSGILKGNLNQFGDYDQCVGIFVKVPTVNDQMETDVKISGKYCLANIDFEAEIHEMKLSVHLAQGRSFIRSKSRDPGHFIPRFTTIRWGICIPSGCTAQDAEQIIEDSIKLYNESSLVGVNFDVSVNNDQCYVRKPPKKILEYHYTTLMTLCIFAAIILFVFISSIRDLKVSEFEDTSDDTQESSKLDKILMSFSLKRTLVTLLKREKESDEIECIHGIRTICTFVLYIAHKIIPVGHTPFTNKVTLTELSNNPFSVLLRLSVIYTDSFLLLSGVLTAYGMSKDMEVKGGIPWFNRMVARFVRLTPALLFVLLYYAYVMEITGEGPLWNTVITPNADLCKDYWWRNILYIQNAFPFQEMCATHTHQLALDMQLSLVAPILVWLLYRRPLMGVFVTILLHAMSLVLRYYATINYRLSLVIYHGMSISQLYRTANMLYATSIYRATPYIAGVGLGVLLRQMKPNFSIHKVLTILGWLVAAYFAGWTLYMPTNLSSRMYIYDVNEAAQHAALCSLGWALALSWMIFACCADNKGYLNTLLSSYPMVILSRLSYTVYLTQFMVFFYNVGTVRSAAEFKITTALELPEIIIVISISTILTLFVDIPAQKIKAILLKSAPALKESADSSEYPNNIGKVSKKIQKMAEVIGNSQDAEEIDDNPISEINEDNPISEIFEDDDTHNTEEDDITEQLDDDDDYIQKLEFEEIHKSEEMEDNY